MKKYVGIFICLFTVFLMVFFIANILKVKQQEQLAQLQVLNRIALDLPHINLANKFFNQPGNERDVKQYISSLNQKLKLLTLMKRLLGFLVTQHLLFRVKKSLKLKNNIF